jgi:hypothetical protein
MKQANYSSNFSWIQGDQESAFSLSQSQWLSISWIIARYMFWMERSSSGHQHSEFNIINQRIIAGHRFSHVQRSEFFAVLWWSEIIWVEEKYASYWYQSMSQMFLSYFWKFVSFDFDSATDKDWPFMSLCL